MPPATTATTTLEQPISERSPSHLPMQFGAFEICGVLGEGGSGVVYAARRDGRDLALKVPHTDDELEQAVSPSVWRRFVSEAGMMAKVRHPNVVEVIDAGMFDDGRPFVAMERLVGCTLAEHVAARGALPLSEALALFGQLGEATAALHDVGLVHRDIKAENVFLVDEGRTAKLLDFGIAKDLSTPLSSTTTGIVRGTPATMAPERFFGRAASEASDVYELTVVLYVMLAGRLPWAGDETDVDARLYPLTLRQAGVDVPEALSCEIVAALSTRPETRPQTVRQLVDRVRAAAVRSPIGLSGRTVTNEHLKALAEHRTPLGTAVTSSPKPRTRSIAPRVPRSWIGVAAVAALAALAIGTASAGEAPAASASAGLVEPLQTIASDGVERIETNAATPAAKSDASETEDATRSAPESEPSDSDDAAAHPRAAAPAKAEAKRVGQAPKPAAAEAGEPAAKGSPDSPIPGGVYETPPY